MEFPEAESDENYSTPDYLLESDPDTTDLSELEIYDGPYDPDPDIANTHESNAELEQRQASKEFFERIKDINTLKEEATRGWLGSLPSQFHLGALPLFSHDETDYQLHLAYTYMGGFTTCMDQMVEFYVHALARASKMNSMELVTNPLVVIPLGKLFVNRHGYSSWTGYEIFVSGSLEVWMIYVLSEQHSVDWDIVDSGLFPSPQEINLDEPENNLEEQEPSPKPKLARLWTSLSSLETATFEDVCDQVRQTQQVFEGSLYLLEMSMYQAPNAVLNFESTSSSPRNGDFLYPPYLELYGLRVNALSPAGSQLLLLTREHVEKSITRLVFGQHVQEFDKDSSLLLLAMKTSSWQILKLIDKSADIDAYAGGIDFNDSELIGILAKVRGMGFDALFNFLSHRINMNGIHTSRATS
ncbi:hypothetical protein F5Y10DRAFT_291957 [Nemania abortiva]|nr:hypothetical protein F5Y10DRAFT_291957 [Nemania abortiva]